jgi:hypothetical protein
MSILVVCHGCKKSFQVSEKFAGKKGPCPKCKAIITIPDTTQEVKVHDPAAFGGARSTTGQLVLEPIARKQWKVKPWMGAAVGGAAVGTMVVAWIAGKLVAGSTIGQYSLATVGLLLLSPVLAVTAYTFLRDDELDPYRGIQLYIRAAACAATYIVLWGFYVYIRNTVEPDEIWHWFLIASPVLVLGTVAAWLSFDLEPGSGFFHYGFYLLVTTLLGWIAGLGWAWVVVKATVQ